MKTQNEKRYLIINNNGKPCNVASSKELAIYACKYLELESGEKYSYKIFNNSLDAIDYENEYWINFKINSKS